MNLSKLIGKITGKGTATATATATTQAARAAKKTTKATRHAGAASQVGGKGVKSVRTDDAKQTFVQLRPSPVVSVEDNEVIQNFHKTASLAGVYKGLLAPFAKEGQQEAVAALAKQFANEVVAASSTSDTDAIVSPLASCLWSHMDEKLTALNAGEKVRDAAAVRQFKQGVAELAKLGFDFYDTWVRQTVDAKVLKAAVQKQLQETMDQLSPVQEETAPAPSSDRPPQSSREAFAQFIKQEGPEDMLVELALSAGAKSQKINLQDGEAETLLKAFKSAFSKDSKAMSKSERKQAELAASYLVFAFAQGNRYDKLLSFSKDLFRGAEAILNKRKIPAHRVDARALEAANAAVVRRANSRERRRNGAAV
ncbi:MAG: hypothetical protein JWP36_1770 [Paucimonas sp.]|nr:hypothetical protein [Paucimonas sp.]